MRLSLLWGACGKVQAAGRRLQLLRSLWICPIFYGSKVDPVQISLLAPACPPPPPPQLIDVPWEEPELRRGMRSQIWAVWVCWSQEPSLEGVGSITIFYPPPGSLSSAAPPDRRACCLWLSARTSRLTVLRLQSLHGTRMQNIPAFCLPVFNHACTWPDLWSSPGKPASLLYLTTSLPDPIPACLRKLNLASFNRCVALGSLPQTLTVMC